MVWELSQPSVAMIPPPLPVSVPEYVAACATEANRMQANSVVSKVFILSLLFFASPLGGRAVVMSDSRLTSISEGVHVNNTLVS
jgi:hypothetical protein